MIKYAAFVRGIGPRDPRKTNERLRFVLEELGFANVASVITSGNLVFESDETDVNKLEALIEAAWPRLLGFEATTIVRSQAQLQAILDNDPFNGVPHAVTTYQLVTFFKRPTKPSFDIPFSPPGKPYQVVGCVNNVMFTIADNSDIKANDVMVWLEKQFSKDLTSRTPLTIQRILNKMSA